MFELQIYLVAFMLAAGTIVVRGPRKIAVGGNREPLWREQRRIETRTKRNHSREIRGAWRSPSIIRGPRFSDLVMKHPGAQWRSVSARRKADSEYRARWQEFCRRNKEAWDCAQASLACGGDSFRLRHDL